MPKAKAKEMSSDTNLGDPFGVRSRASSYKWYFDRSENVSWIKDKQFMPKQIYGDKNEYE